MSTPAREPSLFDRLGGEAVLRPLVADFIVRLCSDQMIGFLFAGVDRPRLIEREFQMTARMLGADVPYEGRPLPEAHARFQVMDGQFARRRLLLMQTMRDHGAPEDITRTLIAHTDRLRPLLVADSCAAASARSPLVTSWRPTD